MTIMIQTGEHEMSTEPGLHQDTFWVVFKKLGSRVRNIWPIFLKIGTNIPFCKSFDKEIPPYNMVELVFMKTVGPFVIV